MIHEEHGTRMKRRPEQVAVVLFSLDQRDMSAPLRKLNYLGYLGLMM